MNKQKIIIILALISIMSLCSSPFVSSYLRRNDWKKDTTPLPRKTIATLCKNLSLSGQDSLCNGSRDVYARDFSEILREYFPLEDPMETPKSKATITYQDVESVIGEYKWECQDVVHETNPKFSYFRCFYDFRGDRYWRDVFYFYCPEETLFSIRSGSSED